MTKNQNRHLPTKEIGEFMSEQAKIADLQEKVRKEKNRAMGLRIFSDIGFIVFVAFLYLYFGLNQGIVTLAVAVVGVLGGLAGIYGSMTANRRKNELMAELDKLL